MAMGGSPSATVWVGLATGGTGVAANPAVAATAWSGAAGAGGWVASAGGAATGSVGLRAGRRLQIPAGTPSSGARNLRSSGGASAPASRTTPPKAGGAGPERGDASSGLRTSPRQHGPDLRGAGVHAAGADGGDLKRYRRYQVNQTAYGTGVRAFPAPGPGFGTGVCLAASRLAAPRP